MRKATLEYDDVMNKQREEIYTFRNEMLHTQDPVTLARDMLESLCSQMSHTFLVSQATPEGWNVEGYRQWLVTHFPIAFEPREFDDQMSAAEIEEIAIQKVCSAFLKKIALETEKITESHAASKASLKLSPQEILKEVVRSILIRNIDKMWQEHLLQIDHLRAEVHLRTVGQKDPLIEFKHEAFSLFAALSRRIEQEIAHALFKFEMILSKPEPRPPIQPRRPLIDLSLLPEVN